MLHAPRIDPPRKRTRLWVPGSLRVWLGGRPESPQVAGVAPLCKAPRPRSSQGKRRRECRRLCANEEGARGQSCSWPIVSSWVVASEGCSACGPIARHSPVQFIRCATSLQSALWDCQEGRKQGSVDPKARGSKTPRLNLVSTIGG